MHAVIVIPARFESKRFPGKPLALLHGQSVLSRVVQQAQKAAQHCGQTTVLVATDDARIVDHAQALGVPVVMTPTDCSCGTQRVYMAVERFYPQDTPDIVINLQGDAPLTPPAQIEALIQALRANTTLQVVTPVTRLSWQQLDALRAAKCSTPFSGTTVIIGPNQEALWFSKQIIPAIRVEDRNHPLSPIYKHIGLYGYRLSFLQEYVTWPESFYEQLEQLEQLRIIENKHTIYTIEMDNTTESIGIDTPEDLERAHIILKGTPSP